MAETWNKVNQSFTKLFLWQAHGMYFEVGGGGARVWQAHKHKPIRGSGPEPQW
jgi:hypothetical protein